MVIIRKRKEEAMRMRRRKKRKRGRKEEPYIKIMGPLFAYLQFIRILM